MFRYTTLPLVHMSEAISSILGLRSAGGNKAEGHGD